jgi:hypothetical protein
MKKEPLWVKLVVWLIIITILLFIGFIFSLPKVIAFDWDWRCLVIECRLLK